MSCAPAQTVLPRGPDAAPADTSTVLIATIEPLVGPTGVQTHSRALEAGLRSAGRPCMIQSALMGNRRWAPVFAIRPLLLRRLNSTWSTWWLRHWHEAALRGGLNRTLKHHDVDAVIAQCPVSARAAMAARDRSGGQFPVILVCHFNYSEATEYREKGELAGQSYFDEIIRTEKQVIEGVDHVVFVSNWARDIVQRDRGIHPRASSVIWNGIPGATLTPRIKRPELGLNDEDLVLINVGTLEPRKNQLALIDLMGKIAPEHPNLRLVLIGDGPSRGQIESRIAQLGLEARVRLLGFRRDVPELLPLADIYAHASLLENCPIVLLEAARAGLAMAAVPAGGVPELLEALGGTPLDLNRPASLTPLLTSANRRAEAGAFARSAFERCFTQQAMVARYRQVLESAAQRGGAAP
ncbi:MAG TPA: glycosyltransferase family 4 protein [Tepidisphaeraceae bacterium]|nr:glycosyltransferase family 4 protein [Tepidisphaeraceae bacterium]